MKATQRDHQPNINLTAALTISAAALLLPANLLPVMRTATVGSAPADMTIFAGVQVLSEGGFWILGAIVFIASIVVPCIKLIGLAILMYSVRNGRPKNPEPLQKLHAALEIIGRWSMLDVFVVGFLSGAVRFGVLSSIEPRAGIAPFAAVVVLTILATRSFDKQLLEA